MYIFVYIDRHSVFLLLLFLGVGGCVGWVGGVGGWWWGGDEEKSRCSQAQKHMWGAIIIFSRARALTREFRRNSSVDFMKWTVQFPEIWKK